jgi:hypothetical protein
MVWPSGAVPVGAGAPLALHLRFDADLEAGQVEARDVGVPVVEGALDLLEAAPGRVGEEGGGGFAAQAGRDDARARDGRVEGHGHGLAGVGRAWPGHDQQRQRAALARGQGLVAQTRVARERDALLVLQVLGEVAQHDHHLALDVEPRIAVVAVLGGAGHDQAVAREDRGRRDAVARREGQGADLLGSLEALLHAAAPQRDARPRIGGAGGELEGQAQLLARQRHGAQRLELRHQVVGRQPLALGSREAPAQALRGQGAHVGLEGLGGSGSGRRQGARCRQQGEQRGEARLPPQRAPSNAPIRASLPHRALPASRRGGAASRASRACSWFQSAM